MPGIEVFGTETCMFIPKIKAAAKKAGVCVCVKEPATLKELGLAETAMIARYPAALTPLGMVWGSASILRYLGAGWECAEMYGVGMIERVEIDALLDAIYAELETPVLAAKQKKVDMAKVVADVAPVFNQLDAKLATRTFLVGHRLSIADITLAGVIKTALTFPELAKPLATLANLARLVNTVAADTEMDVKMDAKMDVKMDAKPTAEASKAPKAKEAKETAAKDTAKEPKEMSKDELAKKMLAEEGKAPVKVRDPIEDLPPTDFDMDAWKRKYSNSKDLVGDAMPYLWEKHDAQGYTFWYFKYQRYNDQDNTKVFMASNMLGMFLQRIDNWLRRYGFAVCNVFDMGTYFDIEGVFLLRGTEIPVKLRDHDQFDSFVWQKLELPKDKQIITDYFCADEEIQGKKIVDCKVYK